MPENCWWQVVEDNWADLINCIKQFHPYYGNSNKEYPITAPGAEEVCKVIRQQIVTSDPIEKAEASKQSKDKGSLLELFSQTWFEAPESREVFNVPGFNILCDLLEEP